jgi:uncharacterized membrane protein YagU involved in acid resistance
MSDEREIGSREKVEMPAPTAWPIVFGLGIVLIGAGLATSLGFTVVGIAVFLVGLGGWIAELLPGRGHIHETLAGHAAETPGLAGMVEHTRPDTPSYRFNLPLHVRPISSGAWGGLVGAILMPIPAMAYGVLEHGSLWLPINLLAGMVVPGLTDASLEHLEEFHLSALVLAIFIHLAFSVTFGLMYGVILPMLPDVKGGPILFGGVLMPLLWSGVCYGLMGVVNPLLGKYVNWYWFLLSQFVYGLAMSTVVSRFEKIAVAQPPRSGAPIP